MTERRPFAIQLAMSDQTSERPGPSALLAPLWLAAAASACAGSSDVSERAGFDAGGGQDAASDIASLTDAAAPGDASAPSDAAPRLSQLVESLFMPSCTLGRCHVTAAPAGELSFTGRRIPVHAALVNAPSSELPQRMRVVPYDPDASYLIEKLESRMPPVGEPMPPLGSVPPEQIVRLRAWIAAGAKDD